MTRRYDYKIFPETWKARVLLGLAFLAWIPLVGSLILVGGETSRSPTGICAPDHYPDCLAAQEQLSAMADPTCAGNEKRVCLVPVGMVSPDLVRYLVDYFGDEYGIEVVVITPVSVPEDLVDLERNQVSVRYLLGYIASKAIVEGPGAIVIGLTAVDLYDHSSHFRYVFGQRGFPGDPKAVASTVRMDPAAYGEPADEELLHSRIRKLLAKYIGIHYYGLPTSSDPRSPMSDRILSPADLDRMTEPLPVME